jgi:hypothetical protein
MESPSFSNRQPPPTVVFIVVVVVFGVFSLLRHYVFSHYLEWFSGFRNSSGYYLYLTYFNFISKKKKEADPCYYYQVFSRLDGQNGKRAREKEFFYLAFSIPDALIFFLFFMAHHPFVTPYPRYSRQPSPAMSCCIYLFTCSKLLGETVDSSQRTCQIDNESLMTAIRLPLDE